MAQRLALLLSRGGHHEESIAFARESLRTSFEPLVFLLALLNITLGTLNMLPLPTQFDRSFTQGQFNHSTQENADNPKLNNIVREVVFLGHAHVLRWLFGVFLEQEREGVPLGLFAGRGRHVTLPSRAGA